MTSFLIGDPNATPCEVRVLHRPLSSMKALARVCIIVPMHPQLQRIGCSKAGHYSVGNDGIDVVVVLTKPNVKWGCCTGLIMAQGRTDDAALQRGG